MVPPAFPSPIWRIYFYPKGDASLMYACTATAHTTEQDTQGGAHYYITSVYESLYFKRLGALKSCI